MSDFWQRRLLIVAAGWNVLGGSSALFDPARPFAQLFTESLSLGDPLQASFFRCTWINVIAWGAAYLLAAFSTGAGKPMLLAAGIVDLVLAALFAVALLSNRQGSAPK